MSGERSIAMRRWLVIGGLAVCCAQAACPPERHTVRHAFPSRPRALVPAMQANA